MSDNQNHRNVAVLERFNYAEEDGPVAVSMVFTDSSGQPFILSMPRAVAGSIGVRCVEMLQELRKAGTSLDIAKSPERVVRYNADRVHDDTDGVRIGLDGDRSAFYGQMSTIDARTLAALLTAASEPEARTRSN